ncbi:hypothetical protein Nmel_011046 [Mimus melanotis]
MNYCGGFLSPRECTKRSLFLVFTISFTAIYLIFYLYAPHHLAALFKSDNLHKESEKNLLKKNLTNFKQISGKENGELPPENEKSGNKATPTPTQSFTFIINEEEKCKDKTPFLVLLISTTAAELQHRRAIRESWGSEAAVPGVDIVRLFMLGIENKGANKDVLLRESNQYHDIIQQDFLDTYNNLTLKTLMGMRWVASYCSGARFAMKTDSDVFVNTMYLIEKLLRPLPPSTQNYFTGHLMKGHTPIRNKASKWYISEEEFPGKKYHPFCSGTGYVFSGDLAAKIVNASLTIKYIHLEDVYIGFCLNAKGVEIVPLSYSLFNIHKVPFSPCMYNKIITSHHIQPHEHILYWEILQEKKHTC